MCLEENAFELGHTMGVYCIGMYSKVMLASRSFDNSIQLWDLKSGHCTNTLDGYQDLN